MDDPVRARSTAELIPIAYAELKRLASAELARLRPGETLRPTALVHEAFLKLSGNDCPWDSRSHFFVAASRAMRELIVDHVRSKSAQKRGRGRAHEPLEAAFATAIEGEDLDDVLAVDAAIAALGAEHPRKAEIVVMRYYAGLTEQEIAAALGITERTVERDWRFARAYLRQVLSTEAR